jgi:hypothetical protein
LMPSTSLSVRSALWACCLTLLASASFTRASALALASAYGQQQARRSGRLERQARQCIKGAAQMSLACAARALQCYRCSAVLELLHGTSSTPAHHGTLSPLLRLRQLLLQGGQLVDVLCLRRASQRM